jgi:hypothetical protein
MRRGERQPVIPPWNRGPLKWQILSVAARYLHDLLDEGALVSETRLPRMGLVRRC